MNLMYAINLILCVIILVFGIMASRRSKKPFPYYIGIAFGLFGVSHLASLLGWAARMETLLIIIRTAAYLIVVYTLYRMAFGRR
jgi:hypothetical protein